MSHFCLVQAICCSRPASEIKKQVPDTAGRLSTPVAAATSVPDKRAGRVTSYPTLSPVTTPRMKTYPWGPRAGERMGHGSFLARSGAGSSRDATRRGEQSCSECQDGVRSIEGGL